MITILILGFLISYNVNFAYPEIVNKGSNVIFKEKGCVYHSKPGDPLLPVKTVFILGDSVKISYKTEKLPGAYHILPAQKPVPISHPEMYTPTKENSLIYGSSDIYPSSPFKILGKRHLFGVTVQEVLLYPISYRPKDGEVFFNYSFHLEPVGGATKVNSSQFKILKNLLINPDQLEVKGNLPEKYVIITSQALAPYFGPLVEWKAKKGILVKIYTTGYIYSSFSGRDDAEKIRNFLKTIADSGVIYVLLGGDTDIIPARYAFAMDAGTGNPSDDSLPADLYYSDLDGNWDANNNNVFGEVGDSVDLLPDVIVGRAPVSTASEVTNFVNKVINYEEYHQSNYFTNALFIASYLDDQTDGGILKDMVVSELPPDFQIQRLYERDGNLTRSIAIYYLNQGANIINHDGHGSWYLIQVGGDYLNPDDFDRLNNAPFITGILYSLGCWTCAIDYDCIAEHFVKAQNGGGFYIGNSRYGWYIPGFPGFSSSDQFDIQFFNNLFHKSPITGVALAVTKAEFAALSEEENDYRWSEYVLTFLGDPEMAVFTRTPESLFANMDGNFHTGFNSLNVRISDPNGNPVEGAKITILQGDSIITTGESGPQGFLRIDFTISSFDSVTLAAFKPGYYYREFKLPVYSPSIFPILSDYGNRNFGIYFADSSNDTLYIVFKNPGNTTTNPETLSININGPANSQISEITIPAITSGDSTIILLPISISPVITDTQASLELEGDTTYSLSIAIIRRRLTLANYEYSDVRVGQSGILRLYVRNDLSVEIKNYVLNLQPIDSVLTLSTTTFNIPDLGSGDSTMVYVTFTTFGESDTLIFPGIKVEDDTIYLSIGYTGYRFSFENNLEGWTVSNNHWHLTNYRSSDGNYSIYVGDDATHQYQPNFTASIQSPDIIVPDNPILSFDTYYETQPGWDFCMVEILHHNSTHHLTTFSGPSAGWEHHSYSLSYLRPGDTINVKFTFYSEDNNVQLEGWYIDNVVLGRNSEPTSVKETTSLHLSGSILVRNMVLKLQEPGDYSLFDISGKLVLKSSRRSIDLRRLPPGMYFLAKQTPTGSPGIMKKIILLK